MVEAASEGSRMKFAKKSRVSSVEFDFEKPGPLEQSVFYKISRPILWIQWILGRTPYYVKSGWIHTSIINVCSIYAFILQGGICVLHWWYREHFNDHWDSLNDGITFQEILFSGHAFSYMLHSVVVVYSWIFEVPHILRNFNAAMVLEMETKDMQLLRVMPRWQIVLKTSFTIVTFAAVLVCGIRIITNQLEDASPALVGTYVVVFLIHQSYFAMWFCNYFFIARLATDLHKMLCKLLQDRLARNTELSNCRRLWLRTLRLSQKLADSIAVSVLYGFVLSCFMFITSCYGILSLLRTEESYEDVFAVLPYFVVSFLNVFIFIEIAHRAKACLKDQFLNTMFHVEADSIDRECYEEVKLFTETIIDTDPQISLKGFIVVDRQLFVSFLANSITYLIVLLQFRASEEQSDLELTTTPLTRGNGVG